MFFRLRRHQSPQPIDFVGFHPADGAAGFFQQSREFSFAINLKMPAAEHSQIPSANSAGEKIIAPIRNDQPPPRTQNLPHFAQRLGRTTNIMKHIARKQRHQIAPPQTAIARPILRTKKPTAAIFGGRPPASAAPDPRRTIERRDDFRKDGEAIRQCRSRHPTENRRALI